MRDKQKIERFLKFRFYADLGFMIFIVEALEILFYKGVQSGRTVVHCRIDSVIKWELRN